MLQNPFCKCLHPKRITNPYTHESMVVPCGHCEACTLAKNSRYAFQCDLESYVSRHTLFITLTYANRFIPRATIVDSLERPFGNDLVDKETGEILGAADLSSTDIDRLLNKFYLFGDVPYLRKTDLQLFFKRFRYYVSKKLPCEKVRYFAVGEYGPVHFRPHYHILLFTNSEQIPKVLRQCHDKSWKLGRSDFQASRGGAASYVASYVNSSCSTPLLYRSCRAFKPRQRASIGFFEKGEVFKEDEDVYHAIEQKIDSVVNGRIYNFNGISVNSTPPMSYIRTLLPRFSSARYDDAVAIARIIRAVANAPKRMARFGIIDYDSDSILSIARAYFQYITLNHHLPNEDEILLHNARCLTRLCNSSSDVDIESYLNKLYRLFLYVSKFLRNWHLPPIGGNLDSYANRIMFIIKTGIEYEKKADYVRMCDSLRVQQTLPVPMLRYFYVPAEGCEMATIGIGEDGEYADGFIRPIKEQIHVPFDDPRIPSLAACNYIKSAKPDTRSAYDSRQSSDLQKCLDFRAATFCRDMIKHKKLNDVNNIFNQMV